MSRQHSTGRLVAGALAVVVAAVALSALTTGFGGTTMSMHHASSGHMAGEHAVSGSWLGLGGPVWWLLLAAVVGVGALTLTGRDGDNDGDALAAARRAYARGDLTDEEYDRRRETLRGDD